MQTLVVGEVLKPQGIRGEIKIMPFTDTAEVFKEFRRIFIGETEYKILSCRTGDGAVYLGLRGIHDRNAAELLRGKQLVIPRDEAPELPEGRYYIADLLGLEIVTEDGEKIGVLKEVKKAAADVYVVQCGDKDILFPSGAGVIKTVEPESGRIVVDKKRFRETSVD